MFTEQIKRIKDKLVEAKKVDKNFWVFGADHHQYNLKPPINSYAVLEFEKYYSITLPACYKAFVTQIGNGGNSYADSAAGPFYGIYPLGEGVDELVYKNPEQYLKNDCVIYPNMADDDWNVLTHKINNVDDGSRKSFQKELGKIYGGILPIGAQGCGHLHAVVLNGQYKGRVVNVAGDRQKPKFAFEMNFLDWYERWLDEVISGQLMAGGAAWFGYLRGEAEEVLLGLFFTSIDVNEKKDCLQGLLNKHRLKIQTLNEIETLIKTNSSYKNILIEILCKFYYDKAKPHLLELAKTDLLLFSQYIGWYAKTKSKEWLNVIEDNIQKIEDEETFSFCTMLLIEIDKDVGNVGQLVVPFTKNSKGGMRAIAFRTLGQLNNKESYIDTFIEGLNDRSMRVVEETLYALAGVKDKRLLKHYKYLAKKIPAEQNNVFLALKRRLDEYGLKHQTLYAK